MLKLRSSSRVIDRREPVAPAARSWLRLRLTRPIIATTAMPATIEATRRETLTSNTFRTPATPGEPAGAGGSRLPAPAAIVASVRLRLEQQLLHAPVRGFGDVDFILRRAGELVTAGKFLEVASRPADHAQHLALERQLEDAAGDGRLAEKEHLVRVCAGRNAE